MNRDSYKLYSKILSDYRLTPSSKLVATYIYNSNIEIEIDNIATAMNLSIDSVKRGLKLLKETNYIFENNKVKLDLHYSQHIKLDVQFLLMDTKSTNAKFLFALILSYYLNINEFKLGNKAVADSLGIKLKSYYSKKEKMNKLNTRGIKNIIKILKNLDLIDVENVPDSFERFIKIKELPNV